MKRAKKTKPNFVVGIDEVGRGPLAGPVSVVALCMTVSNYKKFKRHSKKVNLDLHNSKLLSEKQRNDWYEKIKKWKREGMLDFSYASVGSKIIDEKGITRALRICIKKTLRALETSVNSQILLDGSLYAPDKFKNQQTIIRGDEKEAIISLASIVAKVRRDNRMKKFALQYPHYGFYNHKGYGTLKHRKAIKKFGMCPIHRNSFCRNV